VFGDECNQDSTTEARQHGVTRLFPEQYKSGNPADGYQNDCCNSDYNGKHNSTVPQNSGAMECIFISDFSIKII